MNPTRFRFVLSLLVAVAVAVAVVGCGSSTASTTPTGGSEAEREAPASEAPEPPVPEPSAPESPPAQQAVHRRVVTMDLDGDGHAEVAVGAPSHGQARGAAPASGSLMLHMSRTGRWSYIMPWEEHRPASEFGRDMTSGDVDGNGFDDLIIQHGNAFLALLGGADAEPRRARYPREGAAIPWFTSGGDVHGDGYDDILGLGQTFGTPPESFLLLYSGGSDGVARVPQSIPVPRGYEQFGTGVVLADLTGDGYADAAVQAYRRDASHEYLLGDVLIYEGGAQGLTLPPSVVRAPPEDVPQRGRDSSQDFGRNLYALRRGTQVELFTSIWSYPIETAIGFAIGRDSSGMWTTRELLRSQAGAVPPATGDLDGDGFDEVVMLSIPDGEDLSALVYFGSTGDVRTHPLPRQSHDPHYASIEVRQSPLGVDGPAIVFGRSRLFDDHSVPEWFGVQTLRLVGGQFVLSEMQRATLPNRARPEEWGQFVLH